MTSPVANNRIDSLLDQAKPLWWYHNFILPCERQIRGFNTKNSSVVKAAFSGIEIAERNCVDLGTMDGQHAVYMKYRGAKDVFAFDRKDRSRQISIVRELSGADFRYVPETSLQEVRFHLRRRWGALADFVNFSGILYHMFDPMRGILTVRGMVRRGGLVLLDTPVLVSPDPIIYYNWDDRVYGPGTYMIPSTKALEALCDFLGFTILDAFYSIQGAAHRSKLVRMSLVLRATDVPALNPSDSRPEWFRDYLLDDLLDGVGYDDLFSTDDAEVSYTSSSPLNHDAGSAAGGILYQLCTKAPETPFKEEDMFLLLKSY